MSIAGGIHLAVERGASAGCDAIQLFTKSSNQWKARPLEETEVGLFRERQIEHGISPAVAHDCYLINMASPDPGLYQRSAAAFAEELTRCDRLGLPYLIAHPGAHMGAGEESGFERIAAAIDAAFRTHPGAHVRVLLETTAGMGTSVGHRFEDLRAILDRLERPERVGVCFDTCHVFAAGYDISTEKGYHAVMGELDRIVGLELVRAFHLNDSKKGLGSRLDRHEHIGRGGLGITAFWCLVNDPRFDGTPMMLETPKGEDLREDRENLAILRAQIGSARPVAPKTSRATAGSPGPPAIRTRRQAGRTALRSPASSTRSAAGQRKRSSSGAGSDRGKDHR